MPVTDPDVLEALRTIALPDGFTLVEPADEAGQFELVYSGELSEEDRKAALDVIGTESPAAQRFAEKVSKEAKTVKPSREQVNQSSDWMSRHFYDIRMFGAVMTTGINAGQVRGPIQLTFARSVDPVIPQDLAITRVAITREEERELKETEIGRKTLIPYGLYVGYGFYSPFFAKQSGVAEADLELFWDALINMWDLDRSSARGMMSLRGLYVFTHENKLGNAPAHVLFDLVTRELMDGVVSPRKFSDYTVRVYEENLPNGVELARLVG